MNNRLRNHRPEPRHSIAEPCRHTTVVKGQVGTAGALSHSYLLALREQRTNILTWDSARRTTFRRSLLSPFSAATIQSVPDD
jgi:hypothetical protein